MKENKKKTDIQCILEELESPLTVATEGLNLLKEYLDTGDVRKRQIFNSVLTNVERASAILNGISAGLKDDSTKSSGAVHFDLLNQIQQVCSTHDQLFLQRQLRYRVTASADLPKGYASPDQIYVVLSHLLSNAIKFAPRSSEVEIRAKEVSLRQGVGVELSIINESPDFTEKDRYQIFERFYNNPKGGDSPSGGLGLAVCREIIQKAGGQLWVDIPSKGKVSFTFVLPCAEVNLPTKSKEHQTYKYDISIANFKDLKDQLGSEKCSSLLHHVEESVRKLVRYPIDVVAVFETSGVVSTIYETQEGFASSVATRISQKLAEEIFRVGKTNIPMTFKYHLSVLL